MECVSYGECELGECELGKCELGECELGQHELCYSELGWSEIWVVVNYAWTYLYLQLPRITISSGHPDRIGLYRLLKEIFPIQTVVI